MGKNENWPFVAIIGCVVVMLITAMIVEYKTKIAYIEAGYSQNEDNCWVKPVNCNCPRNNSQTEQDSN